MPKKPRKTKAPSNGMLDSVKPVGIEVTFHDPATSPGWHDITDVVAATAGECRVVGYQVPSDVHDVITIVMGFADNGHLLNRLVIPRSIIKKVKRLRI